MREEVVETEFEYDDEGRIVKKKVTRTYQGTNHNVHPFKDVYFIDEDDDFGLM